MLEVIIGQKDNPIAANRLSELLLSQELTGTLYIGYPLVVTSGSPMVVDAMLIAQEHGVFVFHFLPPRREGESPSAYWLAQENVQNDIHVAVRTRLLAQRELRSRVELAFPFQVYAFEPDPTPLPPDVAIAIVTSDSLLSEITSRPAIRPALLPLLNATIERVVRLRSPRARPTVTTEDSRGGRIRQIEAKIATLDRWQKIAAIETPSGPQRLRGLAGTGKTVVLALKAAYLHALHPEWTIALTFHTRALYQQLISLIRRFSFEQSGEEPDWERLRILHSWGSSRSPGMYFEMARACGASPRDFGYAKTQFGAPAAFEGVCKELVAIGHNRETPPIFDVVLIDEAQDLPQSFFQCVYRATREPKRIVWAYDELQNLSNYTLPPLTELFGTPIELHNSDGEPRQDIQLPICYRNPPWALASAHALGFGVYRPRGLVQYFDNAALWDEVGYEVVEGALRPGSTVGVIRRANSYPTYFSELLTPDDVLICQVCSDAADQASRVADDIELAIRRDELTPADILVVLPNPLSVAEDAARVMDALAAKGYKTHIAGVTSSVDELFVEDSIAITGIFRAKGNEAALVYLLNSQYCAEGPELIRRRNTLFTAVTRARAWVRLYGFGAGMEQLRDEAEAVRSNSFTLRFTVPTDPELARMRQIHRDLSPRERARTRKAETHLQEVLGLVETGEIEPAQLSPSILAKLRTLLSEADGESNADA